MVRLPKHLVQQDDVAEYEDSPPAENTAPGAFTEIIVNVPENITVRMVNAVALEDYEIWFFISSVLGAFVAGWSVAYFQAVDAKSPSTSYVGWTTILFIILFVIAFFVALRKRLSLRSRGKDIKLRVTSVSERKD